MKLYKTETDDIGYTHYRFQQLYKGLNIDDAQFFVHEKEGTVITASGIILNGLNISVAPTISNSDVPYYAKNGNENAKVLSDAELLITRISYDTPPISDNYKLAYKIDILYNDNSRLAVYIDANNGSILKKIPLTLNCEIGTCQTLYNGQQSIKTNYRGSLFNDYQLVDFCHGVGIHTYLDGDEPTDGDNNWSLQAERGATSAHWAAGLTWDYFLGTFGRYGTNNNNGGIDIIASDTDSPLNAGFTKEGGSYNHDKIVIGARDGGINSTDYATIDVVAHEFTHGVTAYTAQLVYAGQSGALNESYSDIFGEMVEAYQNGSCDYVHGEEHASNYFHKRSMLNPSLNNAHLSSSDIYGCPDTYLGTNWYSGTEDFGGVHINSSVQNYWFYLLAEGGSGTNDNGEVYSVQGIGKIKAAAITYRSLTQYMGYASGFNAARNHSIIAAEDLYGTCSNEAIQTANAWYAVGVGGVSPAYNREVCGDKYGTETYGAINLLAAGTSGTCSYTTIHSSANVVFKSANEIDLLPGFTVESGALFNAYIDPCSVTTRSMTVNSDEQNINNSELSISNGAVDNYIENSIYIFPNPNTGSFLIQFNFANRTESKIVKVLDMLGQLVWEAKTTSNDLNANIASYPTGIYTIQVLSETGKLYTKKIIKQ